MRTINLIVVHCSATREDKSFTEHDLDVCHRRRGFNGVGYHFYIRKNGDIKSTRPLERIGAHSRGFNRESIGICYEGGLDCMGQPKDTRTCWQKHSLRVLILTLLKDFPGCRVCGHRDLSPDLDGDGEIEPEEWIKACPLPAPQRMNLQNPRPKALLLRKAPDGRAPPRIPPGKAAPRPV